MNFYQGKRVLITGSTGFKGTWLSRMLLLAGAEVTGYALCPPEEPNLFTLLGMQKYIRQITGDIRDLDALSAAFAEAKPEIVLHLAAQPLVRESYADPVYTYATNVMGTVHLMECVRQSDSVRSVINVTTDKVYRNNEWVWGYRETDILDGYDPYANSKSCSELVTASYIRSFLKAKEIPVSTCRAGNVIGGGDFAKDRIVPDCIRAVQNQMPIVLRNPHSVRPYQHVLEPLSAYLLLAEKQYSDHTLADSYNIGPAECDCIQTGELAEIFCRLWGEGAEWTTHTEANAVHEANFLKLDCSRIRTKLDWSPIWHIEEALRHTVEWSRIYLEDGDISAITDAQIKEYTGECNV